MPIHVDPPALRRAWRHGVNAREEIADAASRTSAARGSSMAGLTACLTDAADDVAGVLSVVAAVIDEHGTGMEACITDFVATDGASAGQFDRVARA